MANWYPIGWTYHLGTAHKRHLVIKSGKHGIQRLACGPYQKDESGFAIIEGSRRTFMSRLWDKISCKACRESKWYQVLVVMERLGESDKPAYWTSQVEKLKKL